MTLTDIGFKGNCQTTAMGIMPHFDVDKALELSLGLDIPFWPQLPNVSYYEDMYAQASQNFPGIITDAKNRKISFDTNRFQEELNEYSEKMADPENFFLSKDYSVVYHRFLQKDLENYTAIRGQLIGPVSFGFKVMDESNMPIIYEEQVRYLLFDFIQRKVNAQYYQLKEKNRNAFVWLDEPGLGWVFSGLSGYDDLHASIEYHEFLSELAGPRAVHLCANVNLPYLLALGIKLLSFDAYQMELMPKGYAESVANFIRNGGVISWGIVPTDSSTLELETPESLSERLCSYWQVVTENTDVSLSKIAENALVAPARCCLKNIGEVGACDENPKTPNNAKGSTIEEEVVEKAFHCLKMTSQILRERLNLYE
jgi:hypothetical protein